MERTVLGDLVQAGHSEVLEGERPKGGGPGRDTKWHGAPGWRSGKCRCLGQRWCQELQAGPEAAQCTVLVASGVTKVSRDA